MSRNAPENSKPILLIKKWRAILSPFFAIIILSFFLYWTWTYQETILETFKKAGITQIVILTILIVTSGLLTALALKILIQDKGYVFRFADSYHSLNLSQLASMIPGGIWGYVGFAGFLWSKGISKVDSVIIILINTLLMLTACAIIGISGLVTLFGWEYSIICLLPFLFLLFGRNWMEKIRQKHYPESSKLPSTWALLQVLSLGILVWLIESSCFAWLFYVGTENYVPSFWTVVSAYATGYLGGYISILAPSGIGVSEGIVALMLGNYLDVEKTLSIAISFRIIRTLIAWSNILVSVILTTNKVNEIKP